MHAPLADFAHYLYFKMDPWKIVGGHFRTMPIYSPLYDYLGPQLAIVIGNLALSAKYAKAVTKIAYYNCWL